MPFLYLALLEGKLCPIPYTMIDSAVFEIDPYWPRTKARNNTMHA